MSDAVDTSDRLLRLLALLSHLARVGEASVADLAARFQMSEDQVVTELELAACCGLPPYTPDQLLELVIDDGVVHAYGLDALRRPPRLTPDEGFALAASARALLAASGGDAAGPLAAALAKLEAALGASQVRVELEAPEHLFELRQAAAQNESVEIDYLGAGSGAMTTRVVEPFAVVAREGHFYLDAYCHLAKDWRRFQVARISAVRPTGLPGEPRTPPVELSGTRAFVGRTSLPEAVVRVPEERAAFFERIASGPGVRDGLGNVTFPVAVADTGWFGRLLLRLGPEATVLSPPELVDAAREEAARALERYGVEGA